MTITRHMRSFSITGVAKGDTGFVYGALQQMRWYPNAVDTGQTATLTVAIIPGGASDSGAGWNIYNKSNNLGVGLVAAPRQSSHDASGDAFDTGGDFQEPIIFAGDKMRVKVTPADTGVAFGGKLYVWTVD